MKATGRAMLTLFVSTLLALTLFFSAYGKEPAGKELVIGALSGLSGHGSEAMALLVRGIDLSTAWINSKGGITIKGEKYNIKVLHEDTQMSPDGTLAAANKLIFSDKVKFILGPPVPAFKLAIEPLTNHLLPPFSIVAYNPGGI